MRRKDYIAKTISTFFYVGYLPFIPGTFGSLCGLGLFFLLRSNFYLYAGVALLITLLGFLVSGEAEKAFGRKDPPCIVIDEVAGMLLSLIFLPYDLRLVIAGFIIFRLLDALKPYPIGSLQRLKGGIGVMGDDLIAAVYTNLILQVVAKFAVFKVV
jgi:phosphatidylglycerophosphatase A